MNALLGLGFVVGGICTFGHYVRCLWKGEFTGGRRRGYSLIYRDTEPVRFWLCAVVFGLGAFAALILGTGLGLGIVADDLDLLKHLHDFCEGPTEQIYINVATVSGPEVSADVRP